MLHYIYSRSLIGVLVAMPLLLAVWGALSARVAARQWRPGNLALLLVSAAVILYATLFSRAEGGGLILTPFAALAAARVQPELYREMLMNVFLFFPLGLTLSNALPRRWNYRRRIGVTTLAGCLLSAGIEYAQYRFALGLAETDDVLCNTLGALLGFSTTNGEAFGIFAGTAINDTSSVTAAASTWDSLYGLGSQTLDKAVTVKLTRTLAIIPITLVLAFVRTKRAKTDGTKVNFKKIFPMFILYFLLASVITTVCVSVGVSASVFTPLKTLSKFLIVMAMCAVGLNTNIVKLVKTGGKPLIMGFCCWVGIAGMSLLMQHVLGIW